jgi:hypothetical protein
MITRIPATVPKILMVGYLLSRYANMLPRTIDIPIHTVVDLYHDFELFVVM